MKRFDYEFPVRIHFGQGCFEDSLKQELQKYGKNVILAYGGGSLKRTGLYDRIVAMLGEAGKTVTDFGGIMPNPTLKKVQRGSSRQGKPRQTSSSLWEVVLCLTAAKLWQWEIPRYRLVCS